MPQQRFDDLTQQHIPGVGMAGAAINRWELRQRVPAPGGGRGMRIHT